jgi:hypothetical protein
MSCGSSVLGVRSWEFGRKGIISRLSNRGLFGRSRHPGLLDLARQNPTSEG